MSRGLHCDQAVKRSHGYQSPQPSNEPPHGTSGHPSHCDNIGKREKKEGGVVGGKQKNKKSTNVESNRLKKGKGRTTVFPTWLQIAATLRPHDLCEPVHV